MLLSYYCLPLPTTRRKYKYKYVLLIVAITLLVAVRTGAAKSEWAALYRSLFGKFLVWPMYLPEAAEKLNKLESMLGDRSAPDDQKAEVEFWIMAYKRQEEFMCTGDFDLSLDAHSITSSGVRRLREEVRRKLFYFCMGRYLPEIRPWGKLDAVRYLTDGVDYDVEVPFELAVKRLKVMLDRRPDLLEHKLFNLRISKEENWERFKAHYNSNIPCKDDSFLSFIKKYRHFLSYIIRPKVIKLMDKNTKELLRMVLACKRYNEMEKAHRRVFDEILAGLLSVKRNIRI